MGTILQFRQAETSIHSAHGIQASLKRRKNLSAEIIIFPGVRIERQESPNAPGAEHKPGKRAKRTARRKV